MSAITAYANSRDATYGDVGSLGPYLQQDQPRKPLIPQWATDEVGKYAVTGAAGGALVGTYLSAGLGLAATVANIFSGAVGFGLIFGLGRLMYNAFKHYKIL